MARYSTASPVRCQKASCANSCRGTCNRWKRCRMKPLMKPRRKRPKSGPVLRICREAHNRNRAPMKVIRAHNNLRLTIRNSLPAMPPLPRNFQRRLHRLRTRVHRQRHLKPSQFVQILKQQRQLVVSKRARSQRDFLRLLAHRAKDRRMAMPLVQRGISRQKIQILPSLRVINPRTRSAIDHHIQRMIVMRTITFFESDQLSAVHNSSLENRLEAAISRHIYRRICSWSGRAIRPTAGRLRLFYPDQLKRRANACPTHSGAVRQDIPSASIESWLPS